MSFGKSESEQVTQPTAPSVVDPVQSPYLKQLYGQSQAGLKQAKKNVGHLTPRINEALQRMLNPGVDPGLQAYQQNVQRNFTDNILPQIQGSAGQANAIGGSRQGVAEGVAAGYANQDITNMAANMYGQDMNRVLAAIGIAPNAATLAQQPYINQGAILGNPTIIGGGGGGGQSSSKGFDIGLS